MAAAKGKMRLTGALTVAGAALLLAAACGNEAGYRKSNHIWRKAMKKTTHTKEQIIQILLRAEYIMGGGGHVSQVCACRTKLS